MLTDPTLEVLKDTQTLMLGRAQISGRFVAAP
jgi:hypothetical protein